MSTGSPSAVAVRLLPALALVCLACGGAPPPPSSSPAPGTGIPVTGRERLGWDQSAPGATTPPPYTYWMYVDGTRVRLAGAECAPATGPGIFPCSAALPPMTPGRHVLELTASADPGGAIESPRSPQLVVVVASSLVSDVQPAGVGAGERGKTGTDDAGSQDRGEAGTGGREGRVFRTSDGITLVAETIASADGPVALRFARDGRLFVAEQDGRIRVLRDGDWLPDPALVLDDVIVGPTAGLLDFALAPDFDESHLVYVLYTANGPDGLEKRIVRYREVENRLGERAVLASGIPATMANDSAGVRFGPDGLLYVLTAQPADARSAMEAGGADGQLLRLNRDGTTPRDNPAFSPVVQRALTEPVAVVWLGRAGVRVAVERARDAGPTPDGTPAVSLSSDAIGLAPAPTSAVVCGDSTAPDLRGDLLVAVPESRALVRLTVNVAGPSRGVSAEALFAGRLGPVAVVACGPDGHLYIATRRRAVNEAGTDQVIQVVSR